jgi:hypothetical protein
MVFLFLGQYIREIPDLLLSSIGMDSILYREESDKRCISPTWGYIVSYMSMDPYLIEYEYIIEGLSLEELTRDRDACSRDDRHISIKHRLSQYITLYAQ